MVPLPLCILTAICLLSLRVYIEASPSMKINSFLGGSSGAPTNIKKENGSVDYFSRRQNRREYSRSRDSLKQILSIRGGKNDLEISSLDWRFFLAGGICAATSHGITTPIDVIKTKIQTNPEKYRNGLFSSARAIVAEEGPWFLLAGLGPTVVGYGIEGALKFGLYESFKKIFAHATPSTVANLLLASVIAGAAASIVLCPMEETRIKMVGEASWAQENLLSGLMRLVRESGIFSTFGGLPAMLSKQVPYTMGKQVSFDLFASLFYLLAKSLLSDPKTEKQTKVFISFASSVCASVLACISSQPGDMILTATYKGHGGHGHGPVDPHDAENSSSPEGFSAIVADIYRRRGFTGFFLGLQARLAHVALIITSQLMLYDIVKVALGLPVTGSH